MVAIILQFLPFLFQAAKDIPEIMDYINKVRASLQQSGEWSQAAEDAYTKELQDLKDNPPDWWKPEGA